MAEPDPDRAAPAPPRSLTRRLVHVDARQPRLVLMVLGLLLAAATVYSAHAVLGFGGHANPHLWNHWVYDAHHRRVGGRVPLARIRDSERPGRVGGNRRGDHPVLARRSVLEQLPRRPAKPAIPLVGRRRMARLLRAAVRGIDVDPAPPRRRPAAQHVARGRGWRVGARQRLRDGRVRSARDSDARGRRDDRHQPRLPRRRSAPGGDHRRRLRAPARALKRELGAARRRRRAVRDR